MIRRIESRSPVRQGMRAWFGRPPRRHGEINEHREVSFVELFYDLVYVVLIGQVSHALAGHPSWSAALDFVVLFGLIWIAWFNGSGYHELHGREHGRARSYLFAQMLLLAVAAAFAQHAVGADGRVFAVVYALLLALLWWQWLEVRLIDTPEYRPLTTPYLVGIGGGVVAMAASAALTPAARFLVWCLIVVVMLCGGFWLLAGGGDRSRPTTVAVTRSLVERFGLIIIIVLGEVVVGVVRGIAESSRSATTLATGVLSLGIGFGLWWNYFDLLGRKKPRSARGALAVWMFGHVPAAMAITASGAGLVGLIGAAEGHVTPLAPATLLSVSVAVVLLGVTVLHATLGPNETPLSTRHVGLSMTVGAVASLCLLAVRPRPWLYALGLAAILSATWSYLYVQFWRNGAGHPAPNPGTAEESADALIRRNQ